MANLQNDLLACQQLFEQADYPAGLDLARRTAAQAQAQSDLAAMLAAQRLIAQGCRALGEYETAITAAREACRLAQETRDLPAHLACLSLLGHVYLTINQVADAIQAFQEGLDLDREHNAGRQYAAFAASIADAYMKIGDYAKAEFMCNRVMVILNPNADQLLTDEQIGRQVADRKITLAKAAEAMRQYHRALYLLEGAEIADRARAFEQSIAFLKGRVYLALGEPDQASHFLAQALRSARARSDAPIEMLAEEQLGILSLGQGQTTRALGHFERAIHLLEAGLSRLRVEEFRTSLRQTAEDVYTRAIQASLATGEVAAAWEYSERARARVFLNLVSGAGLLRRSPRIAGYGPEYTSISNQLPALMGRIFEERQSGRSPLLAGLEARYRELSQRKAALVQSILRQSPLDASLVEAPTVSAQQMCDLLDDETCLVEYFVTGDGVNILWLRRSGPGSAHVVVKRETLTQEIARFRRLIQRHAPASQRDIQVAPRASPPDLPAAGLLADLSRRLYRLLIEPYGEQLREISRLCIVAHDALQYLPFAALRDQRYLVEQVQVCYAPSASILYRLLQLDAKGQPRDVIVFANPRLPGEGLPLPFSEQEARAVARAFPGARLFTGADAKATQWLQEAASGDVLHLACHAHFNPQHPLLSCMLLSPDEAIGDDGMLEVHEIYALQLKASLVVLSGCETAISDLSGGSEYVGLIRAFMVAGAPTVIASQWPVDDQVTAQLMERLYGYLRSGRGKAEALWQAQRDMLQASSYYSAPYYWSAFALHGDWRL